MVTIITKTSTTEIEIKAAENYSLSNSLSTEFPIKQYNADDGKKEEKNKNIEMKGKLNNRHCYYSYTRIYLLWIKT